MPFIKNNFVKGALIFSSIVWFAGPAVAASDEFLNSGEYLSRRDSVVLSAGNAKDSNLAIHTTNPWPYYVNHTRLHGDGVRGVIVVEELYKSLRKPAAAPNTVININN